jgi:hypothetical protein
VGDPADQVAGRAAVRTALLQQVLGRTDLPEEVWLARFAAAWLATAQVAQEGALQRGGWHG